MLGEALRLIRVYHDKTQLQLSYALGISNSYLSEIESGKKMPKLPLLHLYSAHFDIPVSSLLFFSEELAHGARPHPVKRALGKKVLALLAWVADKQEGGK